MDIRTEAERRVSVRLEQEQQRVSQRISRRIAGRQQVPSVRLPPSYTEEMSDASSRSRTTSEAAQLADVDFKLNGARARAGSEDFIRPRWIPDEETPRCSNAECSVEFDWYKRRHHCRHCGLIYCDECTPHRLLLPKDFGCRDPQRVCSPCQLILRPLQSTLTNDIANHQRVNSIEPIGGSSSGMKSFRRYLNMPVSLTLGSEIRKAAYSTYNLFTLQFIKDKGIPLSLLHGAKGLAYLTTLKGGFMFGARLGSGLVISKLPSGKWSAPSAIGTFGVSWGALLGADITDYVIILTDQDAVDAFSGVGQVSIGAGIALAVGPVGRSGAVGLHIGDGGLAPAYSYSHSRGAYAGVSLDGSVIFSRDNVNFHFYGRRITPQEILSGSVQPPRAAQPLYDALAHAFIAAPSNFT